MLLIGYWFAIYLGVGTDGVPRLPRGADRTAACERNEGQWALWVCGGEWRELSALGVSRRV